MSDDNILITGVSGHVGFRVLVEALMRNYCVRAVVRKAEQGEQIRNTESVKPFVAKLEIVVIKDLLVDGAFDNALEGIQAVVHVASPLALTVRSAPSGYAKISQLIKQTNDYRRDVIDPAIQATLGILKSAAKVHSVRRVVVTSSMATLLTMEYVMSDDTERIFTASDTYPPPEVKEQYDTPIEAYAIAKSHALAASERFVKFEKPHFDLISILPSMVIGKNELHTSKEQIMASTNGVVLGPLVGITGKSPSLGASVHLHDVARAHIDALRHSFPGNRRLLCSSGGIQGTWWDDAKDIVRKHYAAQVADGSFPLDGTSPSRPLKLDSSETEALLGWTLLPFEEQVKSVADHYIEMLSNVTDAY